MAGGVKAFPQGTRAVRRRPCRTAQGCHAATRLTTTPLAHSSYGGALSSVRADDLGAVPIRALMARNKNVDWAAVTDVLFGTSHSGVIANRKGEEHGRCADGLWRSRNDIVPKRFACPGWFGFTPLSGNTPTPQCDLFQVHCTNEGVPLECRHAFHFRHRRPLRRTVPSDHLCRLLAARARSAGLGGDTHLSAGRTSLSPAITSTQFAQTSDRRAPSPRDGVLTATGRQALHD
jgi:hypothetical protein